MKIGKLLALVLPLVLITVQSARGTDPAPPRNV